MDLLYKITVRSVIDYALPVYFKTLKQTEISRLENIQYRAAKVVTGAFHYTSREKLNIELGWETIEKRSDLLSLNIFHKIHLHETRPLIRNCMPKLDIERTHALRSKGGYIPSKTMVQSSKNLFPPILLVYGTHFQEMCKAKIWLILKNMLKLSLNPLNINIFLGVLS